MIKILEKESRQVQGEKKIEMIEEMNPEWLTSGTRSLTSEILMGAGAEGEHLPECDDSDL